LVLVRCVPSYEQALGGLSLALQPGKARLLIHASHLLASSQPLAHDGDDLAVGPLTALRRVCWINCLAMGGDCRGGGVVVAVVGGHVGLEGGDSFLPGGVEVGAGWEASGEFQLHHAVGECPDGSGEVLVAGGLQQGRGGVGLDAGG
jgi:hypothetical protein